MKGCGVKMSLLNETTSLHCICDAVHIFQKKSEKYFIWHVGFGTDFSY